MRYKTGVATAIKLQRIMDGVMNRYIYHLKRIVTQVTPILIKYAEERLKSRLKKAARKKPVFRVSKVRYNDVLKRVMRKTVKSITKMAVDSGIDIAAKDVLGPKQYETINRKFEIESRKLVKEIGDELSGNLSKSLLGKVRRTLKTGTQEGMSFGDIIKQVHRDLGYYRNYELERLARTESVRAINKASQWVYRRADNVVGKMWVTDADPCTEICLPLKNKVIDKNKRFYPGGFTYPPAHPNCRCSIAPVYGVPEIKESEKK